MKTPREHIDAAERDLAVLEDPEGAFNLGQVEFYRVRIQAHIDLARLEAELAGWNE